MSAWRLDGKPRTARRFTVYRTCPLATPEDRLFFLLTYLKTYAVQVVQGRLFGMSQSKANQWIHVLLPALLAALRGLGDAPARSLTPTSRIRGFLKGALEPDQGISGKGLHYSGVSGKRGSGDSRGRLGRQMEL